MSSDSKAGGADSSELLVRACVERPSGVALGPCWSEACGENDAEDEAEATAGETEEGVAIVATTAAGDDGVDRASSEAECC